jgi:hypothetical protein
MEMTFVQIMTGVHAANRAPTRAARNDGTSSFSDGPASIAQR